jgi:hypothetical protein
VGATVVTGALVTRLKSAKLFLGFDWLQSVNPKIDWRNFHVEAEEGTDSLKMWSSETNLENQEANCCKEAKEGTESPKKQSLDETPDYPVTFEKVFSEDGFNDLPPRRKWDHTINLVPGHSPVRGRCYPLAFREKEALKDFISTNKLSGKIRGSDSPFASPFFFRPKPGTGELRGIQDYRKLNEVTIKDRYPLPLIQDILRRAQGSKIFTKMDLRWGFNNIRIREGDEHKAAFVTLLGLFEPNVMQFGLCNAPSTFQRMVDEVLATERNLGHVKVYIDDILVHTEDLKTNRYWTGRVLTKLEENQLFCRKEKCQFEKTEVEFLGVMLSPGRVGISPRKVTAIKNEEPPKNKKGIRRFLGITNYHRRFIKGYLEIARPLHELTKDVPFDWSESCNRAFQSLKEALITAPVLALPGDEGKFRLETDASDVATGAFLYQAQKDGPFKPVGYFLKSYNDAEKNYTTYDKEMLAIMRALDEWRSLLIGTREPFEIHTDHRNLTYFWDLQKLTSRQANWMTKLQDYDFVIKHIAGKSNVPADMLSRPEGEEKLTRRTDVLLPERLFVNFLSRRDESEQEEPKREGKGKLIS